MKKVLLLVMIILMVCTFPISIFSSAVTNDEMYATYFENFEYGETDIDAILNYGDSEIQSEGENHFLHFKGNENDFVASCFGPYVADFDFSVRLRQNIHAGDWSWSKILFHSNWGEIDSYRLDLYSYRVQANFCDENGNTKIFGENTKFKFETGEWHTVKICARGTKYTVFIDGEKALNFVSEDNAEGCFGFAGWQTDFDVDDIVIYEYADGEAPEVFDNESAEDIEVLNNERKTRTKKDTYINSILENSSNNQVKKVVGIVFLCVAGISFIGLLAVFIITLIKKKKHNDNC